MDGAGRTIGQTAPDEVLEILRLSQSNIPAWTLTFEPREKFGAGVHEHDGCLTVTPDGKRIIFATRAALEFWDPATRETLGEISVRYDQRSITFSPDGSLAVISSSVEEAVLETNHWREVWSHNGSLTVRGFWIHNPTFMPDGKHCAAIRRSGRTAVFP